jgi:hypothetical protein
MNEIASMVCYLASRGRIVRHQRQRRQHDVMTDTINKFLIGAIAEFAERVYVEY